MANNQMRAANNKFRRLDMNSNSYYQVNYNINRLVTKFGDIVTPKHMRNLNNINLSLGLPDEKPKPPLDYIYSLSEQIEFLNSVEENENAITGSSLAQSVANALSNARLPSDADNGQLLFPTEMSIKVAKDIVRMAEDEPCGLKGCIIYINYEERSNNDEGVQRLGCVRCDATSVPTFAVTLTLKQDSGWLIRGLKECWKKMKNKSVVVSSAYTLTKNKLYRMDSDDNLDKQK